MKIEIKDPYIIALELFILFGLLKLCGYIAWSWWWVTSPLWLPFAAGALLYGGCLLLIAVLFIAIKVFNFFHWIKNV